MNDKYKGPVFGESERRVAGFVFSRCINEADKRVEEDLACLLESHPVTREVRSLLLCIPSGISVRHR
jgi:hypothetical protein